LAASLSSGPLAAATSGRLPGIRARRVVNGSADLRHSVFRLPQVTHSYISRSGALFRRQVGRLGGNIGHLRKLHPSLILRGAAELNGARVRHLPDASVSARADVAAEVSASEKRAPAACTTASAVNAASAAKSAAFAERI